MNGRILKSHRRKRGKNWCLESWLSPLRVLVLFTLCYPSLFPLGTDSWCLLNLTCLKPRSRMNGTPCEGTRPGVQNIRTLWHTVCQDDELGRAVPVCTGLILVVTILLWTGPHNFYFFSCVFSLLSPFELLFFMLLLELNGGKECTVDLWIERMRTCRPIRVKEGPQFPFPLFFEGNYILS